MLELFNAMTKTHSRYQTPRMICRRHLQRPRVRLGKWVRTWSMFNQSLLPGLRVKSGLYTSL